MNKLLLLSVVFFVSSFSENAQAQMFPNPVNLATGQGPQNTSDPLWLVSGWYNTPPNPLTITYTPAYIYNGCAGGSWVNPATLPPPTNNGNWISNPNYPCASNTNAGYIVFRLPVNLPASCNGHSIANSGTYVLYLSGYVDNSISDVYVNGTSMGISGGGYSAGSEVNFTLPGPWVSGINYIDVLVYNTPNSGNSNPYGLLLVANSTAEDTADSDGDGVPDIDDACPCIPGSLANGCPPAIMGDTIICQGGSTTLYASLGGNSYLWSTGSTSDSITVSPTSSTTYGLTVTGAYNFRDSDLINVIVNPLPAIIISPADTGICPGNSVNLTASGGTVYSWSNGVNSASITVSPANTTTYTVTVTNANNCSATDSSTVTIYTLPTAVITPPAQGICPAGSATLTASGGTSYAWSNAANTAAITVSPATGSPYSVTVTDANGCTASTTGAVAVYPLPNAAINPPTQGVCPGNPASLTASGGTSYAWSNAANTAAITVSPITDTTYYTVTVTNANNCTASASAAVTMYTVPVAGFNATAPCVGNAVQFTNTSSPAGQLTGFKWAFGDGGIATTQNPSHLYAAPGNFNVQETVTTNNGCVDSTTEPVTVLGRGNAQFTAPNVCLNDSTAFTNTTVVTTYPVNSYTWNFGDGTGTSTQTSPDYLYAASGNYNVTLIADFTNGCADTGSLQVMVYVLPTVTSTVINDSCYGYSDGSIQLTPVSGLTPFTYLWSNAATTQANTQLATGNYTVTFTDSHQCTATDSFSITQPTQLIVDTVISPILCAGQNNGAIAVNATGATPPYTYSWSTGGISDSITNLYPATYTSTVTDALGCSVSETIILPPTVPYEIVPGPALTITLGDSVTLNPTTLNGTAASWTWAPTEFLSCSDCQNPVAQPTTSLMFTVQSVSDLGCGAEATVQINVTPVYTVYVPNVFNPGNNGNNEYFEVFGDKYNWEYFEISIYDRIGEKVYESNDMNFQWDGTYKGKVLSSGVFVYAMRVVFIDGHTEKLFKGDVTLLR